MDEEQITLEYEPNPKGLALAGGLVAGATGLVGLPALVFSSIDSFALGLTLSIPSAIVGAVATGFLGANGGFYLGCRLSDLERRSDQMAIESGEVRYVTVTYNGGCVQCPLRTDSSGSRKFEMQTADRFAREVSLNYTPYLDNPFSFEVKVLDAGRRYSEVNCEALIQERVGGIDQIFPKVFRETNLLVARANLCSKNVGPDEISHISEASTSTLATMKEFVDGQRRRF